MISFYSFRFRIEFCVLCVSHCVFSVKIKFSVPLLCVSMCVLPGKAIPKMTYTVSGGTLNPTHSLTFLCSVNGT